MTGVPKEDEKGIGDGGMSIFSLVSVDMEDLADKVKFLFSQASTIDEATEDINFELSHIAYLARNKTVVLHVPSLNVVNASSHAGNKITMQDIMILPSDASWLTEAMKMELRFDNASVLRNMQFEF
ncbi:Enolase isoform 2 [Hordeum vulgare]|nr:Enolase isoform 2 [Hordeum vulgare]